MKIFLDTNVIVDGLVMRNESHNDAKLLLALGKIGEFDLWVSPTQWTDLFYILSEGGKRSRSAGVISILQDLRQAVRIAMMGDQEIDRAMTLGWDDVEDAVVHEVALAMSADVLITSNIKDYSQSRIAIYTVSSFFAWLREEKGISYTEISLHESSEG